MPSVKVAWAPDSFSTILVLNHAPDPRCQKDELILQVAVHLSLFYHVWRVFGATVLCPVEKQTTCTLFYILIIFIVKIACAHLEKFQRYSNGELFLKAPK